MESVGVQIFEPLQNREISCFFTLLHDYVDKRVKILYCGYGKNLTCF